MSRLILMLVLPLAALSVPACAGQDAPAHTSAPASASAPATALSTAPAPAQGMVVVRDAQTGQLRTPTASEIHALRATTTAASVPAPPQLSIVTGPGGSRKVRLGERNMVYSVVSRDSDGKLSDQCVHGSHAAEQALAHPAPATKHEEHRHESR